MAKAIRVCLYLRIIFKALTNLHIGYVCVCVCVLDRNGLRSSLETGGDGKGNKGLSLLTNYFQGLN
jgi:hypothetical protein